MNTSNIAVNASQVKDASKHVFLAYIPPFLASFIWKPLKFLCLRAVPLTISYLYTFITYILYYLVIMLRWALVPVLFPLELFIWKPFMAVLMLVYQYRYLIYFTSSAVLAGCLFGVSSYWITSKLSSIRSGRSKSTQKTDQYKAIKGPMSNAHKSKKGSSSYNPPTSHAQAPVHTASKSKKAPIVDNTASKPKRTSSFDTSKAKSGNNKINLPTPVVLIKEEAVIIESPQSYDNKPLPYFPKVVSSPSAGESMDEDGLQDKDGRDRFDEAMKALARQRKAARSAAAT